MVLGGLGGSGKKGGGSKGEISNIHHLRTFYLETSAPELKFASNFMEIGFKFAEIEYFRNYIKLPQIIEHNCPPP